MTTGEWRQTFRIIRAHGTHIASFSGGEPTVRPNLLDIIDAASAEGMGTCLVSNGRAMDAALMQALHDRGTRLSISVPGIEEFERQTGYDGVGHVLSLFRTARKIGMPVTANIAVTKINLPELYDTIAYSVINGATYVLVNRFLPGGRGLDNTQFLLNVDETNEMLRIADEVLTKAGIRGHVGTEMPYCAIKSPESLVSLTVGCRCGAGKSFYAIDPSGYVRTCNHSEHRICHVTAIDGLADDEYWQRFANRDYMPDMCDGCEHIDICDGGCREAAHIYSGSLTSPDPCFCT